MKMTRHFQFSPFGSTMGSTHAWIWVYGCVCLCVFVFVNNEHKSLSDMFASCSSFYFWLCRYYLAFVRSIVPLSQRLNAGSDWCYQSCRYIDFVFVILLFLFLLLLSRFTFFFFIFILYVALIFVHSKWFNTWKLHIKYATIVTVWCI